MGEIQGPESIGESLEQKVNLVGDPVVPGVPEADVLVLVVLHRWRSSENDAGVEQNN
jgi:hypothetical protein